MIIKLTSGNLTLKQREHHLLEIKSKSREQLSTGMKINFILHFKMAKCELRKILKEFKEIIYILTWRS